jgi:hypothetical protein
MAGQAGPVAGGPEQFRAVVKNQSACVICCSFIAALHIIFAQRIWQMPYSNLRNLNYHIKSIN